MKEFTYRNMVSAAKKLEMREEPVCQLGSKEGGFGVFHSHFTCLSGRGVESLKNEIKYVADLLGKTSNELIEELPILREIFEVDCDD